MIGKEMQSLSELSKPVQELFELAKTGNVESLHENLRLLLRHLYIGAEAIKQAIKDEYEADKIDQHFDDFPEDCRDLLRGGFGFYLFASAADQIVNIDDPKSKEKV